MAEKGPRKKALPEDAEAYVAMAKERASPSGKIMERVNAVNQQRLNALTTELEVAQVENTLKSVKGVAPAQTETVMAQIFKDKSAEEIKEIVQNLTPDMIQRLQMLQKATDPVMMTMQQQQQPQPQSGNDKLLEYLLKKTDEKPAPPPQGITMSDVVAIVKLVNESKPAPAPAPAPQPPQNTLQQTIETVKAFSAINEPVYRLMSQKDKEIMDLKMKEMEAKMPQDPIETIKYVKEMSGALGLGNAKGEIDLKLEEMRENKEIDMKRLDWEQEKWKMEQEADQNKWEQISKILSGPLGQAVQGIGNAGADRLRGGRGNPVQAPKAVQTQCPNCGNKIFVDAESDTAICGVCGATLQKQGNVQAPPPVQPANPTPTRVDVPPPESAAAEETVEEEEVDEETEENGHTEGTDETESHEQ